MALFKDRSPKGDTARKKSCNLSLNEVLYLYKGWYLLELINYSSYLLKEAFLFKSVLLSEKDFE
jgi:hypothetical protein